MSKRPTVVIACRVLQEMLQLLLPDATPTYLDTILHMTPKKLGICLQEAIDGVAEPSNIVIGYGLCGNGLEGVKARAHVLIVPRTHDCVSIFLGSHQRYVQRFFANPDTYYLTRGWLEAHDHPLKNYHDYARDYDEETAEYLVDMKYHNYKRLCMVGFSQRELDDCRPAASEVAEFCAKRWNMQYEEIIGSTTLLEALLAMPARLDSRDPEFLVVRPGGEIKAEMFHRAGDVAPQAQGRSAGASSA